MQEIVLTEMEKKLLVELYKAYYTAKEASSILDVSYNKISALYRGFKVAGIERYNRTSMIQNPEVLNHMANVG